MLLVIAFLVLEVGIYGLYKVITDATVAKLEVVGSTTPVETQQVMRYVQPIVKDNYFTSDLEQIR
ncbi:hypothetical protein ACO0SV_28720, partial [Klebsiella pneumoniae]|uniref:hypothetical protein n=1 Tax=Klebsiella pneumoniae TaxID=573 RepID=UPI003BF44680